MLLIFGYGQAQQIDYLSPNQLSPKTYSSLDELVKEEFYNEVNYASNSNSTIGISNLDTCPTGDITITSQADIDALAGCTEITGDLTIDGVNITDGAETITDLSPLNDLTNITGNILIASLPEVTALPTFESLTQINGSYVIFALPLLTSLPNVPNQAVINGNLQFTSLPLITELPAGLSQITTINAGSDFEDNPGNQGNLNLSQLNGITSYPNFDNLTEINGLLSLSQLPLDTLPSLPNLTTLNNGIQIFANANLTSLTGFNSITNFGGTVDIQSNAALTTMNAFNGITSAEQFLFANQNALMTLDGFDSLVEIERFVIGFFNQSFTINAFSNLETLGFLQTINIQQDNFDFLSSVTELKYGLNINNSPNLTNLDGLDNAVLQEGFTIPSNLTSISKTLSISNCPLLTSLGNMDLTSDGHFQSIGLVNNTSLTDLTSLSGVSGQLPSITLGNLGIQNLDFLSNISQITDIFNINLNNQLTDISGIANIDFGNSINFTIASNSSLDQCNVDSVCEVVGLNTDPANNPDLTVFITNNNSNCANISIVESACGICLPGNVSLNSQAEIDNFSCVTVDGNLFISSSSQTEPITNLDALTTLTEVTGNVVIVETDITNLNGLNNLTSIGSDFEILNNEFLNDLSALSSLTNLNGTLNIFNNQSITNLEGLNNITSLSISLGINDNPLLTDISALADVDISNIIDLSINNNLALSECEIASVCSYLSANTTGIFISNNATGCNDTNEVQSACSLSNEDFIKSDFQVFPNPFTNQLQVQLPVGLEEVQVKLYNLTGKIVHQTKLTSNTVVISQLDKLAKGVYLLEIEVNNQQKLVYKLVK